MNQINDHLVLVCGKSATGKSASLMGIKNPEGVMYLNCEAGKRLPFRAKFKQYVITDPLQVLEAFDHAETMEGIHTIVVDSLTYLLDMYESLYIYGAADGQKAWGDFFQYFKNAGDDAQGLSRGGRQRRVLGDLDIDQIVAILQPQRDGTARA